MTLASEKDLVVPQNPGSDSYLDSRHHMVAKKQRSLSAVMGTCLVAAYAVTCVAGCSGRQSDGAAIPVASLVHQPLAKGAALKGKTLVITGPVTHARVCPQGSFSPLVPKGGALIQLGPEGRWGRHLSFIFKESTSNGIRISDIKKGDVVTVKATVVAHYARSGWVGKEATHGYPVFDDPEILVSP